MPVPGGTSHAAAPHSAAPHARAPLARSLFAYALLAAAVLAILVACSAPVQPGGAPSTTPGSGISPGASTSTTGTGPSAAASTTGSGIAVEGTVFSSPGCPGPAQAESPCPDRLVAGARVELTRGNTVVANTTTDAAGRFEMRVPPGDYQVTAYNVGLGSRTSEPISVTGPVNVRLVVDSGMR
jgi:hypothetical protein